GILQLGPRNMRYLEVNHPAAPGRLEAFANDPSGKTWTVVSGAVFRQSDQGFDPVPPFFPMNRSNATSVQAAADGSMIIGTIHGLYRWQEGEAAAVEDS